DRRSPARSRQRRSDAQARRCRDRAGDRRSRGERPRCQCRRMDRRPVHGLRRDELQVRTDDEIYRVDAVWLGPPKATFPWRARYVAWGVGIVVFLLVLAIERRLNIGFGFFSTAWAVVITIAVTRIIGSRISHERPLGAVLGMWLRELTAPREQTS